MTLIECHLFDKEHMENNKSKDRRKKSSTPFAANLKLLLTERGLSQKSAADIMGISVSVIHDWLQGSYPNDPMPILKLCQAINCDFQWLLTGKRSVAVATDNLQEIFDIEDEPDFSGIFKIEAKRLKVKKGNS